MLKKPTCLCCKEYNSNNLEDSFTCFENGIFYDQKIWKKLYWATGLIFHSQIFQM